MRPGGRGAFTSPRVSVRTAGSARATRAKVGGFPRAWAGRQGIPGGDGAGAAAGGRARVKPARGPPAAPPARPPQAPPRGPRTREEARPEGRGGAGRGRRRGSAARGSPAGPQSGAVGPGGGAGPGGARFSLPSFDFLEQDVGRAGDVMVSPSPAPRPGPSGEEEDPGGRGGPQGGFLRSTEREGEIIVKLETH